MFPVERLGELSFVRFCGLCPKSCCQRPPQLESRGSLVGGKFKEWFVTETAQSFAQLWLRDYGDKLYRYALGRVGGNSALAEDLVQETLLAGLKAYNRFEHQATVETWLIGILRRKIVDHYRRQGRRGKEFAIEDYFSEHGSIKHLENWKFDSEELLENREFLEAVQGCLKNLSGPLAEAFSASVLDELDTDEACKLLGVTPTNLSVRLHRARLAMRRCLEIKWFGE